MGQVLTVRDSGTVSKRAGRARAKAQLDCLGTLQRGERLVALTPFKPVPLLPILDQQGFAYRLDEPGEGGACIVICHAEDRDALHPPRAA